MTPPAAKNPDNETISEVPALDFLTQVIDQLRPHLARSISLPVRVRTLWAVAVESRDLAANDIVIDDFQRVAAETGLIADLGRNGFEDSRHIIDWAMRGLDPFGTRRTTKKT